jgi:hypothetical protein
VVSLSILPFLLSSTLFIMQNQSFKLIFRGFGVLFTSTMYMQVCVQLESMQYCLSHGDVMSVLSVFYLGKEVGLEATTKSE